MAKKYNTKVSLIHIDVNYSNLYTGLIDVNLGNMQKSIPEKTQRAMTQLSQNAGYPVTESLSGSDNLSQVLVDTVNRYDVDLVLGGHLQDFWSKLMSSSHQLINTYPCEYVIFHLAITATMKEDIDTRNHNSRRSRAAAVKASVVLGQHLVLSLALS